jgi:peptidoglycan hydrolase-like protein with peptidoglycan-binding domain
VIDSGMTLYSVDGRAVVAVRGAVPAFRAMGQNMVGDDIAQFQQFLADLGLLTAPVDGKWNAETTSATRVWQDLMRLPRSATVELGSIVFLPTLPATATPDPTLVVGAIANEGTAAFELLAPVPRLAAIVSPESTESITGGLLVDVEVGGTAMEFATADTQTVDEAGVITVELRPVSGAAECASWCDAIVTGRPTQLSATVTRAGPLTGVIVPIGALRSGPGDRLFIVAVGGAELPITVNLRVGANAIVDGVPEGTRIELPTAAAAAPG